MYLDDAATRRPEPRDEVSAKRREGEKKRADGRGKQGRRPGGGKGPISSAGSER